MQTNRGTQSNTADQPERKTSFSEIEETRGEKEKKSDSGLKPASDPITDEEEHEEKEDEGFWVLLSGILNRFVSGFYLFGSIGVIVYVTYNGIIKNLDYEKLKFLNSTLLECN